jgi:hypothetical protein
LEITMRMHSNRLKSIKSLIAPWFGVLSDRCVLMLNSLGLGNAFGADDLPVSFILKRDSRRERSGNGKWHYPRPGPVVKGIDHASSVHVAERRADARSTLRPNAEHRNSHRAA